MKRTLSVFLFLLLAFQAGGLLFIYSVQQHYIQHSMLRALSGNDERLEKLILTKEVYYASKVNHFEICLDGKMYDIKSADMQEETVELLAIHDKEEENVLVEIRKLICHSSDKHLPYPHLLNKLLTVFYDQVTFEMIAPEILSLVESSLPQDDLKIALGIHVVATPPPESFFC
ncbi:MAG: hypothetical protein IPJ86_16530 [Bacteroidetes bacterium]|nr:hypothetical protein [Bacteroidota bacterium]MBK9318543.1 hypothetical protein [Bacteroidota bacterium]